MISMGSPKFSTYYVKLALVQFLVFTIENDIDLFYPTCVVDPYVLSEEKLLKVYNIFVKMILGNQTQTTSILICN